MCYSVVAITGTLMCDYCQTGWTGYHCWHYLSLSLKYTHARVPLCGVFKVWVLHFHCHFHYNTV